MAREDDWGMIGDRFSDTKEIDGSFDAGSPHVHARQLVDQGGSPGQDQHWWLTIHAHRSSSRGLIAYFIF